MTDDCDFLRQVGPWSDSLETLSGPGVPESPTQLQLTGRSSHSMSVSWSEPMNNGSTITEYRLEMAPSSKVKRSSSAGSLSLSTTASLVDDQMEDIDLDRLHFSQLPSCGLAKCQEVKGLQPLTTYYFRIQVTFINSIFHEMIFMEFYPMQAVNSVGASGYSPVVCFTTLASAPAPVSGLRCVEAETTCLSISWNAPNSNGSPILHYNVEVGEKLAFSTAGPETCFQINGLSPDTLYRYCITYFGRLRRHVIRFLHVFSGYAYKPSTPSESVLSLRWPNARPVLCRHPRRHWSAFWPVTIT